MVQRGFGGKGLSYLILQHGNIKPTNYVETFLYSTQNHKHGMHHAQSQYAHNKTNLRSINRQVVRRHFDNIMNSG